MTKIALLIKESTRKVTTRLAADIAVMAAAGGYKQLMQVKYRTRERREERIEKLSLDLDYEQPSER